jgi:hypothetical protein
MQVKKLEEAGYKSAMLGLSLSKNQDPDKMPAVAKRLYNKDGGHNKFLESMQVWLLMTLPRYVWQQFDTYRIGMTKQSQSTMHTLMKRPIAQEDFDALIWPATINRLNGLRERSEFNKLKNELPEGFLQTRQICTNYKTLRHIMSQRLAHRLPHWRQFCLMVIDQLDRPEFFADIVEELSVKYAVETVDQWGDVTTE